MGAFRHAALTNKTKKCYPPYHFFINFFFLFGFEWLIGTCGKLKNFPKKTRFPLLVKPGYLFFDKSPSLIFHSLFPPDLKYIFFVFVWDVTSSCRRRWSCCHFPCLHWSRWSFFWGSSPLRLVRSFPLCQNFVRWENPLNLAESVICPGDLAALGSFYSLLTSTGSLSWNTSMDLCNPTISHSYRFIRSVTCDMSTPQRVAGL